MPDVTEYQDRRRTTTAAIASGASLSGAVDLAGCDLVGIQMPAAWTTANLTFQASADGTTYAEMMLAAGTTVVVDAAASEFIALDPETWLGVRYLKIRSGTTGSAVDQGAARTLTLVCRPVR